MRFSKVQIDSAITHHTRLLKSISNRYMLTMEVNMVIISANQDIVPLANDPEASREQPVK